MPPSPTDPKQIGCVVAELEGLFYWRRFQVNPWCLSQNRVPLNHRLDTIDGVAKRFMSNFSTLSYNKAIGWTQKRIRESADKKRTELLIRTRKRRELIARTRKRRELIARMFQQIPMDSKLIKGYVALNGGNKALQEEFVELLGKIPDGDFKQHLLKKAFNEATTLTSEGVKITIGSTVRIANIDAGSVRPVKPDIKTFSRVGKKYTMDIGATCEHKGVIIHGCYGEVVGFDRVLNTIDVRVFYHHHHYHSVVHASSRVSVLNDSKFLPHPDFEFAKRTIINKVDRFQQRHVFKKHAGTLRRLVIDTLTKDLRSFKKPEPQKRKDDLPSDYATTAEEETDVEQLPPHKKKRTTKRASAPAPTVEDSVEDEVETLSEPSGTSNEELDEEISDSPSEAETNKASHIPPID